MSFLIGDDRSSPAWSNWIQASHMPWQELSKQCKCSPWVECSKFLGEWGEGGVGVTGQLLQTVPFSKHTPKVGALGFHLVSASVFWILKLISCCSNCRFRFSHSSLAFCRSLPASTCKRAGSVGCSTHRGCCSSPCCELRSCFTSIRKAAISSKCLACRFRLR